MTLISSTQFIIICKEYTETAHLTHDIAYDGNLQIESKNSAPRRTRTSIRLRQSIHLAQNTRDQTYLLTLPTLYEIYFLAFFQMEHLRATHNRRHIKLTEFFARFHV